MRICLLALAAVAGLLAALLPSPATGHHATPEIEGELTCGSNIYQVLFGVQPWEPLLIVDLGSDPDGVADHPAAGRGPDANAVFILTSVDGFIAKGGGNAQGGGKDIQSCTVVGTLANGDPLTFTVEGFFSTP